MLPVVPPLRATPPAQHQLPPGTCAQPRASRRFRAGLLLQPCFQPWEDGTEGCGRMPGVQICKQAAVCTKPPRCAHFQPVPRKALSLQSRRELFTALDKERGGSLCPRVETALPGWCHRDCCSTNLGLEGLQGPKNFCWKGSTLPSGWEPGLTGEKVPEHSPPTPQRILWRKGIT